MRWILGGLIALLAWSAAAGLAVAQFESPLGDADCDQVVTPADLDALTAALYGSEACTGADANQDDRVSAADLVALRRLLEPPAEPTETPTETPTPPPTSTPTDVPLPGPAVSFFGVASADGTLLAPYATTPEGIPMFQRNSGQGFRIVVEGIPGPNGKAIGSIVYAPTGRPNLQIQSTRVLGDGSPRVCAGGVPSQDPPDFEDGSHIDDLLNDFGCHFEATTNPRLVCTINEFRQPDFVSPETRVQFCTLVDTSFALPQDETMLTVQLADVDGVVGSPRQLIVRAGLPPLPTATFTLPPPPTSTPTRTFTISPTPSITATPSRTLTRTRTSSPTSSATPTMTNTGTRSPVITTTPTRTRTATPSPVLTRTHTGTPTITRTVTQTPTGSRPPTLTPTKSVTQSPTRTRTASRTPSVTSSATQTATPTISGTFTRTPTGSRPPTGTFTPTRSATRTASSTPTESRTPFLTRTATPSRTATGPRPPTFTPTRSATISPTASRTATPSISATSTITPTGSRPPTATVTRTGTPTRTLTPTTTNTASATVRGTFTPTPSATRTGSVARTATPTRTLTAQPTETRTFTPGPSRSPTRTPTVTRTPTPTITPLASRTPTRTPLPPSATATRTGTPSRSPTATQTNTRTATNTGTPKATNTFTRTATATRSATATNTLAPSRTPTITPTATVTRTPTTTRTPTGTRTSTPSPTITRTRTATRTPSPTSPPGPRVTFFGVATANGVLIPVTSMTPDGVPIFVRPLGFGFILIIEGRRGGDNQQVGTSAFNSSEFDPNVRPDLQAVVDRPLGDGSPDVCDNSLPEFGGVPAVNPPRFDLTQPISNAINDLACRFVNGSGDPVARSSAAEACIMKPDGQFGFGASNSEVQFCATIPKLMAFPKDDTVVTVRLRNVRGDVSQEMKLIIRSLS